MQLTLMQLPPMSASIALNSYEVVAQMTFPTEIKDDNGKETRAKKFSYIFAPTKMNYLAFLQTILEKHDLLQYTVSDQCIFPCMVQVPPSKYVTLLSRHHTLYSLFVAKENLMLHIRCFIMSSTLTNMKSLPMRYSRSGPRCPSWSLLTCPQLRRHFLRWQ